MLIGLFHGKLIFSGIPVASILIKNISLKELPEAPTSKLLEKLIKFGIKKTPLNLFIKAVSLNSVLICSDELLTFLIFVIGSGF